MVAAFTFLAPGGSIRGCCLLPCSLLSPKLQPINGREETLQPLQLPALEVQRIDPLSDSRWGEFVTAHPGAWVTHTPAWARVLRASFPQIDLTYLALVERDGLRIRAGLPLCRVSSWLTGTRLVSLPFSTICSPLVEDDYDLSRLVGAAVESLENERGRFLEIRTSPDFHWAPSLQMAADRTFKGHQIDLSPGIEEVKSTFHRRSIRPCIHRAERSALRCELARSEDALDDFYQVYRITRENLSLPPMPRRFFLNMWRHLHPEHLELLIARIGTEVAGAIILLKFGNRVSAEVSGWDRRFTSERTNHFLLWQSIRRACSQGYRWFDFGRTASDNLPLMEFKSRWGTEVKDLAFYFYPNSADANFTANGLAYRLVSWTCRLSPSMFQPLLGAVSYRHSH